MVGSLRDDHAVEMATPPARTQHAPVIRSCDCGYASDIRRNPTSTEPASRPSQRAAACPAFGDVHVRSHEMSAGFPRRALTENDVARDHLGVRRSREKQRHQNQNQHQPQHPVPRRIENSWMDWYSTHAGTCKSDAGRRDQY